MESSSTRYYVSAVAQCAAQGMGNTTTEQYIH